MAAMAAAPVGGRFSDLDAAAANDDEGGRQSRSGSIGGRPSGRESVVDGLQDGGGVDGRQDGQGVESRQSRQGAGSRQSVSDYDGAADGAGAAGAAGGGSGAPSRSASRQSGVDVKYDNGESDHSASKQSQAKSGHVSFGDPSRSRAGSEGEEGTTASDAGAEAESAAAMAAAGSGRVSAVAGAAGSARGSMRSGRAEEMGEAAEEIQGATDGKGWCKKFSCLSDEKRVFFSVEKG